MSDKQECVSVSEAETCMCLWGELFRQVGGLHSQVHRAISNQSGVQVFVRALKGTHSSSLPWRSHLLQENIKTRKRQS